MGKQNSDYKVIRSERYHNGDEWVTLVAYELRPGRFLLRVRYDDGTEVPFAGPVVVSSEEMTMIMERVAR